MNGLVSSLLKLQKDLNEYGMIRWIETGNYHDFVDNDYYKKLSEITDNEKVLRFVGQIQSFARMIDRKLKYGIVLRCKKCLGIDPHCSKCNGSGYVNSYALTDIVTMCEQDIIEFENLCYHYLTIITLELAKILENLNEKCNDLVNEYRRVSKELLTQCKDLINYIDDEDNVEDDFNNKCECVIEDFDVLRNPLIMLIKVSSCMEKCGYSEEEISEVRGRLLDSSNYDESLEIVLEYVDLVRG